MGDHHDTTPIASFEAQASMDHWEEFNDFVEVHANQYLGEGKRSYGLRLACEELFSNIIRHSRDDDSITVVMLRVNFSLCHDGDHQSLMIQIQDNGPYFDPRLGTKRDIPSHLPAQHRPIGGLGLFLVQQSVDRLDYAWHDQMNRYRLYMDLDQVQDVD